MQCFLSKGARFNFGKYERNTLSQVYSGQKKPDNLLIKYTINLGLKQYYLNNNKNQEIIPLCPKHFENIEISDSIVRVASDNINIRNYNDYFNLMFNNISLEYWDFLKDKYSNNQIAIKSIISGNKKELFKHVHNNFDQSVYFNIYPPIINGNPTYIQWCIKNVQRFCIDPEILEEISSEPYFRTLGIKFNHLKGGAFEYYPNVIKKSWKFEEGVFELNERKREMYSDFPEYISGWNDDYDDYDNPLGNPHYNDQLDLDEQSQDFWESI